MSHPGHDAIHDTGNIYTKNDTVGASQPITDLPEHEQLHIGYNVTHDGGLIAMGFEVGTTSGEPWIDPPAHRIGVDVMHLSIPDRFTFQAFVETVGDAVRTRPVFAPPPSPPLPPLFRCFSEDSVIPFHFAPLPVFSKPGERNDWLMVSSFFFWSLLVKFIVCITPTMTGILPAAHTTREANPEPNAFRFAVRSSISFLSYLDAQGSLYESVGVGTRVRLQTD